MILPRIIPDAPEPAPAPEPRRDPTPAQKPREVSDLVWLVPTSAVLHTLLTVGAMMGILFKYDSCVVPADYASGDELGEHGFVGAGSPTTEVSIEGPAAQRLGPVDQGPTASAPAPAVIVTPTPPQQHTTRSAHAAPPTHRVLTAAASRENEHEATPAPTTETTDSPPASQAANAHQQTGGENSAVTSGGRAPGSIGAQRALLPHAVVCNDPVAGTWRAHKFDPLYHDWMFAALRIHHNPDHSLRGSITVHAWDGAAINSRPPPCDDMDRFEFIVDQPAQGTLRGNRVDFGAVNYHIRRIVCNPGARFFMYNPDHFTGTIDPAIQEFQSVNNDGGRDVNQPYVFRRIACEPGDEASGVASEPDTDTPASPRAPTPTAAPTPAPVAPTPTPAHAPPSPSPSPSAPAHALPPPPRSSAEPPADWAPPR